MHEMQEENEPTFSADQTTFKHIEKSVLEKNNKQAQQKEEEYHAKALKAFKQWLRDTAFNKLDVSMDQQIHKLYSIYEINTRSYVEEK